MDMLAGNTGETHQGTLKVEGEGMVDKETKTDELPSTEATGSSMKDVPNEVTIQRMSSIQGKEYGARTKLVGGYVVENEELRQVFERAYTMKERVSTMRFIAALPEHLLPQALKLCQDVGYEINETYTPTESILSWEKNICFTDRVDEALRKASSDVDLVHFLKLLFRTSLTLSSLITKKGCDVDAYISPPLVVEPLVHKQPHTDEKLVDSSEAPKSEEVSGEETNPEKQIERTAQETQEVSQKRTPDAAKIDDGAQKESKKKKDGEN
jgi:hypothetical protein